MNNGGNTPCVYMSLVLSLVGKIKGTKRDEPKERALLCCYYECLLWRIASRFARPRPSLHLLSCSFSVCQYFLFFYLFFSRLPFVVMTLFFGALCNQMLFASMYLSVCGLLPVTLRRSLGGVHPFCLVGLDPSDVWLPAVAMRHTHQVEKSFFFFSFLFTIGYTKSWTIGDISQTSW